MSDTAKEKHYALLQNTILFILETGFSFLVQRDPILNLQTQKLIDQNTIIKINSYFPFFDFYMQFTSRGVLFDMTPPTQPPHLEVRTTLQDLFKILFFANKRSLKSMRVKGSVELRGQFEDWLLLCTLPQIIAEFPKWFSPMPQPEQRTASMTRIAPLLETIEQQREQLAKLKLELKETRYQYDKVKRQVKNLQMLCYITLCIIIGLLIGLLCF